LKIAVHQPNFIPWIGFFNKIYLSDVFVILDDIQFPGRGSENLVNRNYLLINRSRKFLTIPIEQHKRKAKINEIQISWTAPWQQKFLKTVEFNYCKAQHYHEVASLLELIASLKDSSLFRFNLTIINLICDFLSLDDKRVVLSSDLKVNSQASERLRDLILSLNGDTYICGTGSSSYLNEKIFEESGINIVFQNNNYNYPSFESAEANPINFSILHSLMHLGKEKTRSMLIESHFHSKWD